MNFNSDALFFDITHIYEMNGRIYKKKFNYTSTPPKYIDTNTKELYIKFEEVIINFGSCYSFNIIGKYIFFIPRDIKYGLGSFPEFIPCKALSDTSNNYAGKAIISDFDLDISNLDESQIESVDDCDDDCDDKYIKILENNNYKSGDDNIIPEENNPTGDSKQEFVDLAIVITADDMIIEEYPNNNFQEFPRN